MFDTMAELFAEGIQLPDRCFDAVVDKKMLEREVQQLSMIRIGERTENDFDEALEVPRRQG